VPIKAEYKLALRQKDRDEIYEIFTDLNDLLLQKDQAGFLKTWDFKFSARATTSQFIDGSNNEAVIADIFATVFENACSANSASNNEKLRVEFDRTKLVTETYLKSAYPTRLGQ